VTVLQNTWRQLVRRRLWPVAVLLVAALAAVPVMLKREAEPVAAPAEPVPAEPVKVDPTLGEPVVAMASAEDRDRRRRVLGARKDPFEPAPAPKAKEQEKAPEAAGDDAGSPGGGSEAPKADSGVPVSPPVDSGPIGGAPVSPPVEEPVVEEKKKTYPANSLIVRFGDATDGMLERGVLERLEALPEETEADQQPLLVYLGLDEDRNSAIFMVDQSVVTTGDGTCHPHPSSCETVHLNKGEIQFFDVKDETGEIVAQYQLDLVAINAKKKTSAKQARRALARAAKTGRSALGVAAQVSAGL
jgi:hypothetical protein